MFPESFLGEALIRQLWHLPVFNPGFGFSYSDITRWN